MSTHNKKTVLAIAAHPDDIEFMMAGTLLQLRKAGYEIHYFNIANGNRGSKEYDSSKTIEIRGAEARNATSVLGAVHHASLCNDLEVLYDVEMLKKVTSVVREVAPSIVLAQSYNDYMEDHINACRLAVSAAFSRGMPNLVSIPPREAVENDVALYHALPYGLRGPMNEPVTPHLMVDITDVIDTKTEALACHKSQQNWLEVSQGHNSYLAAMTDMAECVGAMTPRFIYAEGWMRHSTLGFCADNADPLSEALGELIFRK